MFVLAPNFVPELTQLKHPSVLGELVSDPNSGRWWQRRPVINPVVNKPISRFFHFSEITGNLDFFEI